MLRHNSLLLHHRKRLWPAINFLTWSGPQH